MTKINNLKHKKFTEKKPLKSNYLPKMHNWHREKDGFISNAMYSVGYCNGPECIDCGLSDCHHCNQEMYKDTNCLYRQAIRKWEDKANAVREYNKKVTIINKFMRKGYIEDDSTRDE